MRYLENLAFDLRERPRRAVFLGLAMVVGVAWGAATAALLGLAIGFGSGPLNPWLPILHMGPAVLALLAWALGKPKYGLDAMTIGLLIGNAMLFGGFWS